MSIVSCVFCVCHVMCVLCVLCVTCVASYLTSGPCRPIHILIQHQGPSKFTLELNWSRSSSYVTCRAVRIFSYEQSGKFEWPTLPLPPLFILTDFSKDSIKPDVVRFWSQIRVFDYFGHSHSHVGEGFKNISQ